MNEVLKKEERTDTLRAILNLINKRENHLRNIYTAHTRVNLPGVALEHFVKDAFCNTFDMDPEEKDRYYRRYFSFLGSPNNPPDLIVRRGDAVEIKKLGGLSTIQLNSSCPHTKLYRTDERITEECRNCEEWKEREFLDYLYVIGIVKNWEAKILLFLYGDCYFAEEKKYLALADKLKEALQKSGETISETREIGRVNEVDPLKVTDLRIRGMWLVKNPLLFEHFKEMFREACSSRFSIYALMREEKFESFPNNEKNEIQRAGTIEKVQIPDPNDPTKKIRAILIKFLMGRK